LVEGKDDKELFNRLKLSIGGCESINVDSSDILDDHLTFGLGAKQRIDAFVSQIPTGSSLVEKFRCFVDREWEELVDQSTLEPLPWTEPKLTEVRLKTNGHSIENYGFVWEFVEIYLKHFGRGVATELLLKEVSGALPNFLRAAAAFSEVARKRHVLSRCTDIIDLDDIDWDGEKILLKSSIECKLSARGCQNANGILEEYLACYAGKWSVPPFETETHYHAHGHIGDAIIWGGIAKISMRQGVSEQIGREIATGRQDEKRRVWHGWLSGLPVNQIYPIRRAFADN